MTSFSSGDQSLRARQRSRYLGKDMPKLRDANPAFDISMLENIATSTSPGLGDVGFRLRPQAGQIVRD